MSVLQWVRSLVLFAIVAFALTGTTARGALVIDLDYEFSGGTPPAGTAPWLRATFSTVAAGTVDLMLEATSLSSGEFVSGWYLNFDPELTLGGLTFTKVASNTLGSTTGSFTQSISTGVDAFKAAGDGWFDIRFSFGKPPTSRFDGTDRFAVTITSTESITENSFDFVSVNGPPGKNGFLSAAHVQGIGIGNEKSGWIAPGNPVPEPASVAVWSLLTMAGIGFTWWRKRVG